jgi:hypothetical protein
MISTSSVHTNVHLVFYVSECTCPAISQQLKTRQAMYCTYNLTTFFAVENQKVLRIMSKCFSVRYPACKEHVPYCHLWPAPFYGIFPLCLTNSKIFRKEKLLNIRCVSWFSPQILSENISHSKKNWVRYDQNCMLVFMYSTRYSCQILMKLEFSQHIFEIYSNDKFHENSSSVRQVVPCGRTERETNRHEEAHSSFSQFCERA